MRTHGHLLGSEVTKICPPPTGTLPYCPACGCFVSDGVVHSLLECQESKLSEVRSRHLPDIEARVKGENNDGAVVSGEVRIGLIMRAMFKAQSRTWNAREYNQRVCRWLKEHRKTHPTYSKYCASHTLRSLNYYARQVGLDFGSVDEEKNSD